LIDDKYSIDIISEGQKGSLEICYELYSERWKWKSKLFMHRFKS
jgi:hypothetical protein